MQRPWTVGIGSARPDGATAVAIALAARLSVHGRTLLADVNQDRPEVAVLLDTDQRKNLYHLAFGSRVQRLGGRELADAVTWRGGLAILGGITDEEQAALVTAEFVAALIDAASEEFEYVVLDCGRLRPGTATAECVDQLACVLRPGPLGLASFDATWRQLEDDAAPWRTRMVAILNGIGAASLDGVDSYLQLAAGIRVMGKLPSAPALWTHIETQHSLDALLSPVGDESRFVRAYGADALEYRRELDVLTKVLHERPAEAIRGASHVG